ncbi:MAG: hypothetical protein HY301_05850 [Verrucomicrobia bacterium]|nr:hypothetical protein [Verrucomicrobiota bacterium]
MKLQQGQVWKRNDGHECFRIVVLERLAVQFKALPDPESCDGTHQTQTKKEFCRLLKNCTLLAPEQLPPRPADRKRGA